MVVTHSLGISRIWRNIVDAYKLRDILYSRYSRGKQESMYAMCFWKEDEVTLTPLFLVFFLNIQNTRCLYSEFVLSCIYTDVCDRIEDNFSLISVMHLLGKPW